MNKKISLLTIFVGVLIIGIVTYLTITFSISSRTIHPYYQVYMSGNPIGLIESDQELYDMIDKEQEDIKKKYGVDKIYPPSGLIIEKVNTYKTNLMSTKEVYEEIKDLDPFTIEGYQVIIKDSDNKVTKSFYILNKEDLDVAMEHTVEAFVNKDDYNNYLSNNQKLDGGEGTEITDIYFEQNVILKKTYISTEERIITDPDTLSIYFLFGTTDLSDKYTVQPSDTIETIAYNNELGVSDFLIANPDIVNEKALLAIGQEVSVAPIEPVANVVVESFDTTIQDIMYNTQIEYDKTLSAEETYVKQEGSNGSSKVKYATKYTNGVIMQTAMVEEEVISEPVDRVIVYGGYNITYIGSSTYWAWPTTQPYRISSYFGYRIHPVYGYAKFHEGVDITGTSSDNIYAIQGGTVVAATWSSYGSGNYVKIDHGNGYTSTYMHLAKILTSEGATVEKGEIIGIMGCTGTCTGKHLHFQIEKNGSLMNPFLLYQ